MRVLFLVGCFCFAVFWYRCHHRYLAGLVAGLGIWLARYFDAIRTWVGFLGTDSLSEAQRFDWSEASFFLKTGGADDFYWDNAGLIITRRIHCAMPCAAMGIPVVFSGLKDGRTRIVDILGLHCKQAKRYPRSRIADFPREVIKFEDRKRQITEDLHARLEAVGVKVKIPV